VKNTYDRAEVDDLAQEALCRIVSSIHTFAGRSSLSTWIYAVCRNVLYSHLHEKRRWAGLRQKMETTLRRDVNENIELRIIIKNLPARLFTIYELFYVQRYSIEDIAHLLDLPPGTVKYRLFELQGRVRAELS
jgi:RNA polymerase sigma-70 factor (ECF subfamily)